MKNMKPAPINSQTEAMAAMTKASAAMADKLTAEEEERAKAAMTAKADGEFAHLGGSTEDRVALLMAIDKIEDDDMRAAGFAAIKMPEGMTTENKATGADAELDAMAKAHQSANPGTTIEAAHAAVLKTPIGKRLYAKTLN